MMTFVNPIPTSSPHYIKPYRVLICRPSGQLMLGEFDTLRLAVQYAFTFKDGDGNGDMFNDIRIIRQTTVGGWQ